MTFSEKLRKRWPDARKWRLFQVSMDSKELANKLVDRLRDLDWETHVFSYPDKSMWDIRAWTSIDNPDFDYDSEIERMLCPKDG